MKALTPAAGVIVKDLRELSYSMKYEDARTLRRAIDFIAVRDIEVRKHREKEKVKQEFEFDCG